MSNKANKSLSQKISYFPLFLPVFALTFVFGEFRRFISSFVTIPFILPMVTGQPVL
jgi:hypothetical protein